MKKALALVLFVFSAINAIGQAKISNDSIFIDNVFFGIYVNDNTEPPIPKALIFKPTTKKELNQIGSALRRSAFSSPSSNQQFYWQYDYLLTDSNKFDFAGSYLETSAKSRAASMITGLSSGIIAALPILLPLDEYVFFSLLTPEIAVGVAIVGAVAVIALEIKSIRNTREAGKALRHK
jgi:hypothetical protein